MTETSIIRHNRIIEAFRDWACLETFPLTTWACDELLHSIDRGDHDRINTPTEIARARRILERLRTVREAIDAERPGSTLCHHAKQIHYAREAADS